MSTSTVEPHTDTADTRPAEPAGLASPLPQVLVPFERYLCADHRPQYPMQFCLLLELRGEMQLAAVEAAVDVVLQRHPLLSARVRGRGRQAQWVAADGQPRPLFWCDTPPAAVAFGGEAIDLTASAGFRVDVQAADGRTRLVASFHHAVCDGIGALQVVGDLLAHYGMLTASGDRRPRLLPVDQQLLPVRGSFDLKLTAPVSRWQATKALLAEGWKVLARRPRPLRAPAATPAAPQTNCELLQVVVSEADWQAFCDVATRLKITANDLLLRDFFLALRAWQNKTGWLRVTVPTSLRARRDLQMPAVNMIGYGLVSRHGAECDESAEFRDSLAQEMDFLRRWGIGSLFNYGVWQVDRVPGLLWLVTRLSRSFATSCLSNLGHPLRRMRARFPLQDGLAVAGDVVLERLACAPPVRPGTRLSIAVNSYGGQLTIAAQYDPRHWSADAATDFLELFRDRLTAQAHELPIA